MTLYDARHGGVVYSVVCADGLNLLTKQIQGEQVRDFQPIHGASFYQVNERNLMIYLLIKYERAQ